MEQIFLGQLIGGGYIRLGGDSGLRYKQSLSERKHKEFA